MLIRNFVDIYNNKSISNPIVGTFSFSYRYRYSYS